MSDYIKRENVIDELIDVGDTFDPETVIGNTVRKELARLKIKIMRIPTADVTEEKHGQWQLDEDASCGHIEYLYTCSACRNCTAWGEAEKTRYCP